MGARKIWSFCMIPASLAFLLSLFNYSNAHSIFHVFIYALKLLLFGLRCQICNYIIMTRLLQKKGIETKSETEIKNEIQAPNSTGFMAERPFLFKLCTYGVINENRGSIFPPPSSSKHPPT